MKTPLTYARIPILLLLSLTFSSFTFSQSPGPTDLQKLIDQAPDGSTVKIPPGTYIGQFKVAKALTLDGDNQVTLDGAKKETTLTLSGNDITLRNLRVRGSGPSHDRMDSAILASGSHITIENVAVEDSLFGIMVKDTTASVFRRNKIRLRDIPLGERGDSIRLWNSRENEVSDNEISRSRDIGLHNSPHNQVVRNKISDSRIGIDLVFSGESLIEDNTVTRNLLGIAILYSNNVTIRRNSLTHMNQQASSCITVKESFPTHINENEILHCSTGIVFNSGTDANQRMNLNGNRFMYNGIGVRSYGIMGSIWAEKNAFTGNMITVAMPLDGDAHNDHWLGNEWDEYQGFDLNRDGLGDQPFEYYRFADRIWIETPEAMFFLNSPFFELIDFLERLAPFSSPDLQLVDPAPRVHTKASARL